MNQRIVLTICITFLVNCTLAQQPKGTWVMAHIKAKQPVLSATMEKGELVFDEGEPYDSSEVYTPGLMVLQFEEEQTARSFSWDGNENWTWRMKEDSLLMYSQKDTLFGDYSGKKMVMSSTIDNVPTEYTFLKIPEDLELDAIKPGWEGQVTVDDHPFNLIDLTFQQNTLTTRDTEIPELELYLTTIGPLQVIEYSFDREYNKVEFGIIYLFRERRKLYKGFYYPVVDDFREPKEVQLEIRF